MTQHIKAHFIYKDHLRSVFFYTVSKTKEIQVSSTGMAGENLKTKTIRIAQIKLHCNLMKNGILDITISYQIQILLLSVILTGLG